MMIKVLLFCALILHINAELTFESNDNSFIIRKDDHILRGTIKINNGNKNDIEIKIVKSPETMNIVHQSNNTEVSISTCFDLNKTDTHWFGGPERKQQVWPLEEMVIQNTPWTLSYLDNFAVIEPYWLNSKGIFIHISENTPLWVDQNNNLKDHVCFIANASGPYVGRNKVVLNYTIGMFDNPKEAHLFAVNTILGKPSGYPNEKMIREPIWTTWAKYKKDISDDVVLGFSDGITGHNLAGQIEIDDAWETCYGAQEFSNITFPNIANTVKALHDKNFRVTLWVHPFVDENCNPNELEGISKDYFVKNTNGSNHAYWWNNNNSHQIDFTNPEAQNWFVNRLEGLRKKYGIDGFKCDAGEINYVDQPGVYQNVDINSVPNILSKKYVETCARLGDLTEVRSSWKTQNLPIFVRMLDKDSNWGLDNGLRSLIPTLLQMNMNGYGMVLPDMIGGNGYNGPPDEELLVRWAQANVFMPAMQFSYLPWDGSFYNEVFIMDTIALHAKYSDEIIEAMKNSVEHGTPVNPPIWWIDPLNEEAHKVNDEFLLGEKILVAPVLQPRTNNIRDVYLPKGTWKDGNNGDIIIGPTLIQSYFSPINLLPYFIKQ